MNEKINKKSLSPSRQEQINIVKDTNEVAVYLYNYYVSVARRTDRDLLNDGRVGAAIGWTARKVRDNRLKLTNTGWIYFKQKKIDGVKYSTWVFGQELVIDFKRNAPDVSAKIKATVFEGEDNGRD